MIATRGLPDGTRRLCSTAAGSISTHGDRGRGLKMKMNLSNELGLRLPGQALPHIGHSLPPQLLDAFPIAGQFRQNPFHLRHDVALICERHLVPHLRLNGIPWSPEVDDYGDRASGERFEDYTCTVIAK